MSSVAVIIPTYCEEEHLGRCLDAVSAQTRLADEVVVVDGGSNDRTVDIAREHGAQVLHNPERIQAAALNVGLRSVSSEIVVRVDGHCAIAPDYVERCVELLGSTSAAMVGGAMTPVAGGGSMRQAIAAAMASPFGAGPARFHVGGKAGWVDTVYLGAYRLADALAVGGYRTDVGVNEDSEFAHRMAARGGVWFDPTIRSTYVPRNTLRSVTRQFWRYGLSRATTTLRHPRGASWRQAVAPGLLVGLATPARRKVGAAYTVLLAVESVRHARRIGPKGFLVGLVLPAMHIPWGAGMLVGLLSGGRVRPVGVVVVDELPTSSRHAGCP